VTTPVIMMDGVAADVPQILSWQDRHGRHPVGAPGDGRYEWTAHQLGSFPGHIRYSVLSSNPGIARSCRVKDIEAARRLRGDAGPEDAAPFLIERADAGHQDGTIYASLATVPAVLAACERAQVRVPRWWLAWWWGRPGYPTVAEALAYLKGLTGVELDPATIWAIQAHSYSFADFSAVYGPPDFTR
jgi:hypothetical protein